MQTIHLRSMMATSGVCFGTSGARGLVSQFSDEVSAAYTLAFLQALGLNRPGQSIALGMDLRPSSPEIARVCATAIMQAGCTVDFCGVLPTPALALHALTKNRPAIMVTGSHIPFDRNGIKFYRANGEISKADEVAIIDSRVEIGNLQGELPAMNIHALDNYRSRFTTVFSAELLKGWRIGVYEHSSAARDVLKTILKELGAEVIGLARTDTFVPIDTEAVGIEDRQRGRQWANEYQFDALVSTDGDGDRPLIGDENGEWLRGDLVGLLTGAFLKADTVVTPVSSNTAIEACGLFTRVLRTCIGSPYVIAAMESVTDGQAVAGFEANGGFLAGPGLTVNGQLLPALPTRDAVLPALAVMALARQRGCKISDLTADLPARFTASDRLQHFAPERSQALLTTISSDPASEFPWADDLGDIVKRDNTDGLRLTFAHGDIVHLRPSGNAPELRCYVESMTAERANDLVVRVLQSIEQQVK